MGDVDKDTSIAQMMSMTGSEDFALITRLLEENAWCVELAVETYNTIQSNELNGGLRRERDQLPPVGDRGGRGGRAGDASRGGRGSDVPYRVEGYDQGSFDSGDSASHGGDVRVVGDFRTNMRAERNPTDKTFESRQLQQLFKSPDYAEKLGADGWRGAGEKAKRENRYIILNIQEGSNFWSHRVDRDIWANESVKQVVTCDYLLVQVWKDGDNYRDIVGAYPGIEHAELPVIMLLDSQSRMELKRITYRELLKHAGVSLNGGSQQSLRDDARSLALSMSEILTTFVERQEMERNPSMDRHVGDDAAASGRGSEDFANSSNSNNNNNNNNSQKTSNNGGHHDDDDIATALRLSEQVTSTNANSSRPAAPAVPEPSDAVDTLEKYRAAGAGEGILKLRVKLPSATDGSIIDWDIFLPKSTPQRAFTRGVRFELRANRASAVPPRSIVRVQRLDRSRKLAEIFAEAVGDATANADEGATLGDVEGMRSGEVLWIELTSAAV